MLSFTPKTEEELVDTLEIGEANFEVYEAAHKDSKSSGLPMIELKMKVWDKNGTQGIVYDYLMLNDSKFFLRKIRHFCFSAGLEEFYNAGRLHAHDCVGKQGKCTIGIQKDKTGKYPDKNVVNDYLYNKTDSQKKYVPEEEAFNDDIPWT